MPDGLKRYQTSGSWHFVTFTCYHRFPYLNDNHSCTVFESELQALRQRHQFDIFGYVLMPNHVHLLLSEPKLHLLADTFRALKTQTSRQLKGDRKQFWQRRYFDRNIITQTEFSEKHAIHAPQPCCSESRRKA